MDVFQGLPSNSVPLCLTSWENLKKSAKTSEKNVLWSDETKIELFGHNAIVTLGGKRGILQAEEHHPNRKLGGGSIMMWGCFAAGWTGALHKIDGIMREENCVDILKQHLKTSVS